MAITDRKWSTKEGKLKSIQALNVKFNTHYSLGHVFVRLPQSFIKYRVPCLTPDMFNHSNLHFINAPQTFIG